ncbi:E3 SUMO-protein ligase PIAS1 [Holothuria leucospilota]|uniref:E3 SUMO-protein ligase PIAS1 n=1 Tax=Holothuria leucospilota TaxID=206669 RepID=A0A9Q1C4P9_HOLLE|nr:E3 SUMO-protein ligase PIAS1 [Holothuria leucospilota]
MNDGLYVDFIQVPLICVYTHKRIDVPCRTLQCQHIQCFDASALFQKPRYIRSVLQQTSSEDIQIYADCTWASVKDPDESHTDKALKDGSDDVIDLTNETVIDLTELDVTIDEIDKTLQNSANDDECIKS